MATQKKDTKAKDTAKAEPKDAPEVEAQEAFTEPQEVGDTGVLEGGGLAEPKTTPDDVQLLNERLNPPAAEAPEEPVEEPES